MKKKSAVILVSAATALSLLTGCSSGGTYGKYVTLGTYKGLSVNKIKTEVTDNDVESEIESALDENSEYKTVKRAAKDGDQVNIDFTGTIDGEKFDGSSDTDYELVQKPVTVLILRSHYRMITMKILPARMQNLK